MDARRRTRIAQVLALAGGATALALAVTHGPIRPAARTDLGLVEPAALDSVAFADRSLTASLRGTVARVETDGTAWVERRGRAFPVVSSDTTAFVEQSSVLVVGRLRSTARGRWLEARAWTHVRGVPQVTGGLSPHAAVQRSD
jgi:hypothetical protein